MEGWVKGRVGVGVGPELRDEARRLRGENARLLSILACREQELHELKNLDSADHGTFKCVREVVLASLYLEPLNRVRSA